MGDDRLYPKLNSLSAPLCAGDTVYRAVISMGKLMVELAVVKQVRNSVVRLALRGGLAFDCKSDVPNDRRLGRTREAAIRGLIEDGSRAIGMLEQKIGEHRYWIGIAESEIAKLALLAESSHA